MRGHERDVAGEDRRRDAEVLGSAAPARLLVLRGEAAVDGRAAASRVRLVEDVVVHQGGRLEQFRRGGGADGGLARASAARVVSSDEQAGAQALASRGDRRERLEDLRGRP